MHRLSTDSDTGVQTVEVWHVTTPQVIDETGEVTTPEEGEWVAVPVQIVGGRLQFVVRCVDKSTFENLALFVGLMKPILDENNNLAGLTHTRSSQISQIGPIIITPAVMDEETEITPAVVDNRWHANAMLSPVATRAGAWEQWALTWTLTGSVLTEEQKNANEYGVSKNGIELLDPKTIITPARTFT